MIDLNKQHDGFDMRLEVLCLIPKLPARVEIQSIASDLGVTAERAQQLLREVGKRHIIDWAPGQKDMAVGAPKLNWQDINDRATRYFDQVYNGKSRPSGVGNGHIVPDETGQGIYSQIDAKEQA